MNMPAACVHTDTGAMRAGECSRLHAEAATLAMGWWQAWLCAWADGNNGVEKASAEATGGCADLAAELAARLAISRSVCSLLSSSRLALRSCEARELCSSSALFTRRLHIRCRSTAHPTSCMATVTCSVKVNALHMTLLGRVQPHALTVHLAVCTADLKHIIMKDHVNSLQFQLHSGSAEGVLSCPRARNIDLRSFDLVICRSGLLLQHFLHAPMRYGVVGVQVSLQEVRILWTLAYQPY